MVLCLLVDGYMGASNEVVPPSTTEEGQEVQEASELLVLELSPPGSPRRGVEQVSEAPAEGPTPRPFVTSRVLVQVVSEVDALPVPGIVVVLEGEKGERLLATSNDLGETVFQGVPVGDWRARCVCGGSAEKLKVMGGDEYGTLLRVPETECLIRVVDNSGGGVFGAEVRVSWGPSESGIVAGTTDYEGELTLRPITYNLLVEASAIGFAPSARYDAKAGDSILVVPLVRGGGSIIGRVVDAESGIGLVGAKLVFGYGGYGTVSYEGGVLLAGPSPAEAVTGSGGHFSQHGLPAFSLLTSVRAHGFAPWLEHVDAQNGSSTHPLLIELYRGHIVSGQVCSADGAPLEGASVRLDMKFGGLRQAKTGPKGQYLLENVRGARGVVSARHQAHGQASVPIAAFSSDLIVNLKLNDSETVGGKVVDDLGVPIQGALVGIWSGRPGSTGVLLAPVVTGVNGEFRLLCNPSLARSVGVKYPRNAIFPLQYTDALLGQLDITFAVDRTMLDPAEILCEFHGVLAIQQVHDPLGVYYASQGSGAGPLSVSPLPAGSYKISISNDDGTLSLVGTYTVSPGQVLDLGLITSAD